MNEVLKIKLVAISSVLSFLLALYIFGYALDKYKTDPDDFTISRAVADGNSITAATIVFAILGSGLLIYLHHLRGFKRRLLLRDIIILAILALFISIIFVTPYQKDGTLSDNKAIKDAHIGLAAAAFTLVFAYNLFTYYIFYKIYNTRLPLILAGFNILIFIGLFVPVIIADEAHKVVTSQDENDALGITFATFENLNYLSLLVIILLLGFYKV
jgi:hypothetical protein